MIAGFVDAPRPKILESLLAEPRLPIWRPSKPVDEETQQFFNDLAIPSVHREPSLLMHELDTLHNPAVDTVFSGAKNR